MITNEENFKNSINNETVNTVNTLEIGAGEVKVWNLSSYLYDTVLNPKNLFPDPLFERRLWVPGAYNKGDIIYRGEQIILDGRAAGKKYTRQVIKFNVSEDAYVFEIEMMRLDDSFPVSYPILVNMLDVNGNNLTNNSEIFPSAAQLLPGKWHKVRVALPTTEGAAQCAVSLGISDTGGYLAFRRPKFIIGTDTKAFDSFAFDLNEKIQNISQKNDELTDLHNPLYGKSVLFAGESIASHPNSYAKQIPLKYTMTEKDLSAANLNLARINNTDNWCILGRVALNMETDDTQYDYIILESGVNDIFNCPLGEVTEGFNAQLDETTYCGALESLLKCCLVKYIGKPIGVILTQQIGNQYNAILNKYYIKAREICEKYSVPYLDLYKSSGVCCAISEVQQALFGSDVIHMNAAGHALIIPKIEAWMKTL